MTVQPINPADIKSTDHTGIGYRERSLWVSLAAVGLVDTFYFAVVVYSWWSGTELSANGLIGLLVVVVGLLLLIELAFVLVSRARRESMDERDQSIAAGAAMLAYTVFSCCVVLALALHLLNVRSGDGALFGLAVFDVPLIEVHLVLVGLVTAELVRHSTALMRYRRGY